MRKITEIIIHCTATPEGRKHTAADVDAWHRRRGFDCIGYHFLVRIDGTVEPGRPLEKQGAHCLGHNAFSIGICYVGGLDSDGKTPKDTRTEPQRLALKGLVGWLLGLFPGASVHGHNEFVAKACPCFDVRTAL